MAEYVEREAVIKDIEENFCVESISEQDKGIRIALKYIKNFPAADVVEVVRCKDCKFHREVHYEDEGEPPCIKHVCKLYKRAMQLDDFCSYGERKEKDHGEV